MMHGPAPASTSRGARLAVVVALVVTAVVSPVRAAWPTDPASPLDVGAADVQVQIRHAVAGDGATWVAWIDALCFGALRVQRIAPGGAVLAPGGITLPLGDEICGITDVALAVAPDGAAIVRGGGESTGFLLHRVAADGSRPWGDGVAVTAWNGGHGAALGLDRGEVLLSGYAGMSVFVSRRAPDGTALWTSEIPSATGPNKRVLALVPDGAGGAFVLWDVPLTYTRMVFAVRVDGAGAPVWPGPVMVVPPDPSSSRHTDPGVVADGSGGVVIVFARGRETADTPVPLLVQRVGADGTLAFDPQGVRVALDPLRQYDPVVARDDATGDLVIAWRSGPFGGQTLRAQRMTTAGARLWGDTGVTLADLGPEGSSFFDAAWDGTRLTGVVSRPAPGLPSVRAHRVDAAGAVIGAPVVLSGDTASRQIAAGAANDAVTVSWFDLVAGVTGDLVAQRLNVDDTLGVVAGDLDADGTVGFADLSVLLAAWGPCPAPCAGDLDGDGSVGFADLTVLLAAWG